MTRLPNWLYDALDEHGVSVDLHTRDSFAPVERRERKYVYCGWTYRKKEGRAFVDEERGPFRTMCAAMVDAALHYRLMHEDGTPTKLATQPKVVPLRRKAA